MNQFSRMSKINIKFNKTIHKINNRVEHTLEDAMGYGDIIKVGLPKHKVGDSKNYKNFKNDVPNRGVRSNSVASIYSTASGARRSAKRSRFKNVDR